MPKQLIVPGHALKHEGAPVAFEDGTEVGWGRGAPCAQCSCGVVSPPRQSKSANQRWHRSHKVSIVEGQK